ncbi:12427_t:CDS:2, partial [Acaulospora colombiana]
VSVHPVAKPSETQRMLDREYRQAVSLQQNIVEKVQLWHNEELPDHIERVKAFTKRVIFEYSNMASNIVPICSKAVDSTEEFLCSNAIESSDERRLSESWDKHLQPVSYHNFALGAKQARPIFGIDSTPEFVLMALSRLQKEEGEA